MRYELRSEEERVRSEVLRLFFRVTFVGVSK
jgi:hypothetical protein